MDLPAQGRRPFSRRFWPALLAVAVVAAGTVLTDCSFVTARTNGQCLNDNDCHVRGPNFASTRCSAAGTCVVVTVPEAGPSIASGPCSANIDCNNGTQGRCIAGNCVSLTNSQCTIVNGDPTAPNAIFVGVMTPLTGVNSQYGLNQYGVIRAAASEWSAQAPADTRQFVVIGCDEIADPGGAASFLATTVETSAIFGPIYDSDFEQAVFAANLNGTIIVGPRVDDPKLSTLTGIGKTVWSMYPNRKVQETYFQSLISTLEPKVKAARSISGDMTLAIVAGTDPSSSNFADDVVQTLQFNGKSVLANGVHFQRVNFQTSLQNDIDYGAMVSALVQAAPDLVVVTQEYDLLNFVRAINNSWSGPAFPRFLLLSEDPLVDIEILAAGPSERFRGQTDEVTWATSAQEQSNATAFSVTFRSVAGSDPSTYAQYMYDAFYQNAYGINGVLQQNSDNLAALDPVTYRGVVGTLNGPGQSINVGAGTGSPNNISQILTDLKNSVPVDLDGTTGPLQMDVAAGSPVQDAVLKCLKSGLSPDSAGVTFSGSTGAVTGTYSCL